MRRNGKRNGKPQSHTHMAKYGSKTPHKWLIQSKSVFLIQSQAHCSRLAWPFCEQTSRLLSQTPRFNPNALQVGFGVYQGCWGRLSSHNISFTLSFIIVRVLYSKPSIIQGMDNGSISGVISEDYNFIPPGPNNKKKVSTVRTKPTRHMHVYSSAASITSHKLVATVRVKNLVRI